MWPRALVRAVSSACLATTQDTIRETECPKHSITSQSGVILRRIIFGNPGLSKLPIV